MPERDDNQERTEQATEHHLRQAREKGDVPRSQDLSAALVILACVGSIVAFRPYLWNQVQTIMRAGLSYNGSLLLQPHAALHALRVAGVAGLKLVMVPGGAALLGALVAPVLAGGYAFSAEALSPKPDRLNPAEGLKRMVSLRSLVELSKSILKVVLVGGVLAVVLWTSRFALLQTGRGDTKSGIAAGLHTVAHAALLFAVALGAIAAVDVLWQRFDYARRMRMSRQELRDENKETEGSPETRARVRKLQRQMAKQRIREEVPKANVIVANPEHFAVAVRYDEATMTSPVVVAKGLDLLAVQIRLVATRHDVPIVAAPALARALYHTTRVGQEIPAALYTAVAQILAWVYRAQHAAEGDVPKAPDPDIDPQLLGPYQLPDEGDR